MLPLWISHYKKHVPVEDLYIIDHDSVDGSTDNVDVTVMNVTNGGEACETFKTENISYFQRDLLASYEAVLYVDADEFVFPSEHRTLVEFLNENKEDVFVVRAWEPLEYKGEDSLDWKSPIMEQRSTGVWHDIICKPILSRKPLTWCHGQHYSLEQAGGLSEAHPELYMIHLHRIDKELNKARHKMRWAVKHSDMNLRSNFSNHWSKVEGKDFEDWYNDLKGMPLEGTPQYFKEVL